MTFKRPDYNANVPIDVTKDVPKDDTKDNNPLKSDWSFVALAERLPKDCRKEVLDTLRLIVNNPSIKHKEIAERLAVSERTAGTYVAELKRYCIKRVGGNTFGHCPPSTRVNRIVPKRTFIDKLEAIISGREERYQVTAIAKMHLLYAVLRDTSMANDSTATNFEQLFKTYSPDTVTKIL